MNDFSSASEVAQLWQAYLAGFAVSLTPCVYPLIPITLSLFGASQENSRLRSFLLALTYVVGIACTYTVLGMISALTGSFFGAFLGNPIFVLVVSVVLFLLACSTLEVFGSGLFSGLQNRASRIGGKGFRGAFLMGTASGFVAAPCAGPVLLLILGVAGKQGRPYFGALLLFVYAIGFGTLFLLLGAFPSLLRRLPRSGNWLMAIKFIIAFALIMAIFFLAQRFTIALLPAFILDNRILLALLSVASLALAVFAFKRDLKLAKLGSAVLLAAALFPLILLDRGGMALAWEHSLDAAMSAAQTRHTIAMVDLYADWCGACKELDAKTFSQPEVIQKLSQLALGKIDFTTPDDTIAERYSVTGLPCVMFLNPDGSEIPNSRITGFLPPAEFLAHLAKIKGT